MKKPAPKMFFASALTAAAGCSPVTFRSWRNRNGLFQRPEDRGGWNRFSNADMIAAAIVTDLTKRGMNAQTAVDIAMKALPVLEESERSEWLLVSFHGTSKIEVSRFKPSELAYGVSPVYFLIDLESIRIQILKRLESRNILLVDGNGAIHKTSFVITRLPGNDKGVVKKTVAGEDKKLAGRTETKARVKKELGKSSRRVNGPKWRPRAGG